MSDALLLHQPCPHCGSSDAASLYPAVNPGEGEPTAWWTCFSCDKRWPDDAPEGTPSPRGSGTSKAAPRGRPPEAVFVDIPERGLASSTLKRAGYYVNPYDGTHWATYTDPAGGRCAWKVRGVDEKGKKTFHWEGTLDKRSPLFLQSLWTTKKGRILTITEGEIDALSIAQAQGFKWPVVSIPNGASAAARDLAGALEWLSGFEKIVLLFDNDAPGREATEKAVQVLPPGRAYIAKLPSDIKDPNDALVKGRIAEVLSAIHSAQPWLPGGIVSADEVVETLLEEIDPGIPWHDPWLTDEIGGRQLGDTIVVTGATSSGKSDWLYAEAAHLVYTLGEPVGVFSWESSAKITLRQIIGKATNKRLHIPDPHGILYTEEDVLYAQEYHRKHGSGKLFMNDAFGVANPEEIFTRIRYLRHAHGVRHFILDPLTAMAATFEEERTGIDKAMAAVSQLGQELGACMYLVSHLSRSAEGSHEEGARVKVSELRGSGAIGFWAHKVLAVERDQQSIGGLTTLRILKWRVDGSKTGRTNRYVYDVMTGRLVPYTGPVYEDHDE